MTIRLLKFTEYTENAICIYRNFSCVGIFLKVLIAMRIIADLLLTSSHCIIRTFHYMEHEQCKTEMFYFYLTSVNSICLILLGCYHSEKYKCLSCHLNSGCRFFNNDKSYLKSLKSKHAVSVGLVFLVSVLKALIFGYTQLTSLSSPNLSPFWHYVYHINLLVCDFRYIFEFLVLYCVLHVMSEQLLSVTRSIDKEKISKNNSEELTAEVDKWSVIYKHIRASAKLFNDIFGVQLTIMLTTTMFYYIIFLYAMASQSLTGKFTTTEMCQNMGTLLLMLVILCMVSCAAQAMENSADTLRRRLCKLLILSTNSECCKATRDLLRMMSTRPIRARAFGSISIGMTLLPTCVSFFTSYTVIALQFNNVL